ncbi:MAG: hypothetical protein V1754_05635 [Pseudomonadota bacterium]
MFSQKKLNNLVLSLGLMAMVAGCSESVTGAPSYVTSWCKEYFEFGCNKLWKCTPTIAALATGLADATGCKSWADTTCTVWGATKCPGGWPSESQYNNCMDAIEPWTYTQFIANPDGPQECAFFNEACVEPDQDAGLPQQDRSTPYEDSIVYPDSTPGSDTSQPLQDLPSTCPYTTTNFSCTGACENIWLLLQSCSNDTNLPPNLQAAFKVMAGLNKSHRSLHSNMCR